MIDQSSWIVMLRCRQTLTCPKPVWSVSLRIVFLYFFLLAHGQIVSFSGEPVVLIVGVDTYESPRSQDAKYLMETILQCGFAENQTILMTSDSEISSMEPTFANLEEGWDRLSSLVTPENDLVLVVLTGPCCSISGKLSFCPDDGNYNDPRSMLNVTEHLKKINTNRLVLVMDSTFPDINSDQILPPSVTSVDMTSIPEHAVLFMNDTTIPTGVSPPDKSLCRYFADILKEGKADLNGDGKTEVRELLRYFEVHPERLVFKGFRPGKEWDDEFFAGQYVESQPVSPPAPPPKPDNVGQNETGTYVPPSTPRFPMVIDAHPNHRVNSFAFFQRGQNTYLISGADDQTIKVHQLHRAEPLLEQRFYAEITSVAVNSSGTRFLVATRNMLVELWEMGNGDEDGNIWLAKKMNTFPQFQELHPGKQGVLRVAFHPKESHFLAASAQAVCVWANAPGTDTPVRVIHPNSNSVFFDAAAAVFLPDTNQILTAFAESPVSLWSLNDNAIIPTALREYVTPFGIVNDIAYSPISKKIVSAGRNNKATVWDVSSNQVVLQFDSHSDDITSVAFSPNGRFVLTGSHDGSARFWEVRNAEVTRDPLADFRADVLSVAFSPDGEYFALGLSNGKIMVYSSK